LAKRAQFAARGYTIEYQFEVISLEAMMTAHAKSNWNWRNEGFKFEPQPVQLSRLVTAYRVWGGTANEIGSPSRPGVCFSFEQPQSRKEAEGLSATWEWGNTSRFITQFQIQRGARIFVGKVHPGDFYDHGLGIPGSQIFVETDQVRLFVRKTGFAHTLRDDLGSKVVVSNRDPGRSRSS
jgi:hypothetical protein